MRQRFERPKVIDVYSETQSQLQKLNLRSSILPGQNIAVTAGSRGITNIPEILRSLVDHIRSLGG
ncbi:MAG TPA: [Fe-S]-binding protein, partial [Planctomycetaceae bacterium]|nr:[Fe-S]-binding protein [Planctomycetaceae bacterium]